MRLPPDFILMRMGYTMVLFNPGQSGWERDGGELSNMRHTGHTVSPLLLLMVFIIAKGHRVRIKGGVMPHNHIQGYVYER